MPTKRNGGAAVRIPKSLGAVADRLYTLRERRYALQREVDKLQKEEAALREHLIQHLPKSDMTGASGKIAHAQIDTKREPVVEDWEQFYAYIGKKKAFDLLQRRVSTTAVRERWDNKETVPGVGAINIPTLSLTKVKTQ